MAAFTHLRIYECMHETENLLPNLVGLIEQDDLHEEEDLLRDEAVVRVGHGQPPLLPVGGQT